MTDEQQNPEEEESKKRSDERWTGLAFLPIGITFFILGLNNSTYLAIGIPFLILGLSMMFWKSGGEGEGKGKEEPGVPDDNGTSSPSGGQKEDK